MYLVSSILYKGNDMKKIKKGFTLLELLVVISIIGILVALGAVAFTTAQQKGRDARRMGDLKAIQNAQEQYYAENTVYVNFGDGGNTCAGAIGNTMETIPTDPKGGDYDYGCRVTANFDGYCIEVLMEQAGKGNCDGCWCDDGEGRCSLNSGADYFCVKHLQ